MGVKKNNFISSGRLSLGKQVLIKDGDRRLSVKAGNEEQNGYEVFCSTL